MKTNKTIDAHRNDLELSINIMRDRRAPARTVRSVQNALQDLEILYQENARLETRVTQLEDSLSHYEEGNTSPPSYPTRDELGRFATSDTDPVVSNEDGEKSEDDASPADNDED